MIKNVTINGKDMFATWGAELTDSALEALLTPPAAKEYIENSARTEHGVRITVPSGGICFDSREVLVTVKITGISQTDYLQKYVSFVKELISGKIALRIPELDKEYNLCYLSVSKYGSHGCNRGKFAVKFREEKFTV